MFALAFTLTFGLALGSSGCNELDPPFPIQYETEHLRIGAESFLCGGDLVALEDHIAYVEDDLEIAMDRVVDVYVWDQTSTLDPEYACTPTAVGCYDYDEDAIYSTPLALHHELVHAIVHHRDLASFFREGIAGAYGVEVARLGAVTPSENLAQGPVDRGTATHFVRWLRDEWGGQRLGELARRDGAEFEAVYGFPLAEAEAAYLAEFGATVYPPPRDCYFPEFDASELGKLWSVEVRLDCRNDDTHNGEGSLYVQRTLDVPHDGRYSLSTDASSVAMYRCEDEPGEPAGVDGGEPTEVPSIYEASFYQAWREFSGQTVHTVKLQRGRYHVVIRSDGDQPRTARMLVWPWPALTPIPLE